MDFSHAQKFGSIPVHLHISPFKANIDLELIGPSLELWLNDEK
jgi:hypothetical protein